MEIRQVSKIWTLKCSWVNLHITKNVNVNSAEWQFTCINNYIHTTYTEMHAHLDACTHTWTYACMHTHTHTQTLTHIMQTVWHEAQYILVEYSENFFFLKWLKWNQSRKAAQALPIQKKKKLNGGGGGGYTQLLILFVKNQYFTFMKAGFICEDWNQKKSECHEFWVGSMESRMLMLDQE